MHNIQLLILSASSKMLRRGAVSIEEYLSRVNMAHMVKSGQLRATLGQI